MKAYMSIQKNALDNKISKKYHLKFEMVSFSWPRVGSSYPTRIEASWTHLWSTWGPGQKHLAPIGALGLEPGPENMVSPWRQKHPRKAN